MAGAKVMIVLAVVGVGAAAAYQATRSRQVAAAREPTGPQSSAEELPADMNPDLVMVAVASAKKHEREAAADQFVGMWVVDPGWTGAIQDLNAGSSGTTVVLTKSTNSLIGAGYTIVVSSNQTDLGLSKNDVVTVKGRIGAVESLIIPNYPAPIHRIRLEKGTIRKGDGGR